MNFRKGILQVALLMSLSLVNFVSATNEIVGDYNGDGYSDAFNQALSKGEASSLTAKEGSSIAGFHTSWLTSHPNVADISDWSEQSYSAFSANLNNSPGDELLLLGNMQLILLHGDIVTPISIFPEQRNAIVSWDANGVASYTSFDFNVDPVHQNIQFADVNGDGYQEIILQGLSAGSTLYVLNSDGSLKQTMVNGYLGQDWSGASYSIDFVDDNSDGRMDMRLADASGNLTVVHASSDGLFVTNPVAFAEPWAKKYAGTVSDAVVGAQTVPANNPVGAVAGSGSVSGGAATYNIPIIVPPGRNQMAPSLSLSYSSKSGSREAGFGWSLSGLSRIQRCERDFSRDGVKAKISYTDDDRLCLNGQRLVLVAGTYGANNSEYRTEIESFVKVKQVGTGSSRYFEVKSKSGLLTYYGKSANSRIIYQGKTHPLGWSIEQVKDIHGNQMDYVYTNLTATGEFYLDHILYTGYQGTSGDRKVKVNWQDDSKPGVGYYAGGRYERNKRISSIETSVNSSIVNRYHLTYKNAAISGVALLKSVKQCALNGNGGETCLEPTTFDWYNEDTAPTASSVEETGLVYFKFTNGANLPTRSDINGDGFPDEFNWSEDFSESMSITWGNSNRTVESFTIPRRKVRGFADILGVGQLSAIGLQADATRTIPHEGRNQALDRVDFLTYQKSSNTFTVQQTPILIFHDTRVRSVDMNGDGLSDILGVISDSTGFQYQIGVFLNNNGSFSATPDSTFWVGASVYSSMLSLDLDQDGNMDLVGFNGFQLTQFWRSNGSSFDVITSGIPSCTRGKFGDINGDGAFDLICNEKIYWNTGDLASLFVDSGLTISGSEHYQMADLNKDGKDEIYQRGTMVYQFVESQSTTCDQYTINDVVTRNEDGHLTVRGSGVGIPFELKALCENYRIDKLHTYNWNRLTYDIKTNSLVSEASGIESSKLLDFFDYDLDGDLDIFAFKAPDPAKTWPYAGRLFIEHNNATPGFEKLKQVTNALGYQQSFEYTRLNDTTHNIYSISSGSVPTYPEPYINSNSVVVHTSKSSNGVGGLLTKTYQYQDGRQNYHGRGYLGFGKITVTDVEANKRTETFYEQSFPLTSQVKAVNVYKNSTNKLLSSSSTTHRWFGPNDAKFTSEINAKRSGNGVIDNKTYLPFVTNVVNQTYALDSSNVLLSKTTTNSASDLDNYGNLLKSTTLVNNGYSSVESVTDRTFFAVDTTSWWINKLNTSTVTLKTLSGSALHNATLDPTKKVKTTYTWTTERQPDVVTVTPISGGGKVSSVDTDYNAYGLPIKVIKSSSGESARSVTFNYSKNGLSLAADGYFVYQTTNELNHTSTQQTYPAYGQVKQKSDANGLVTSFEYDVFGRAEKVIPPVGTGQPVYTRLAWCDVGCGEISNSNIRYKVTTYQLGAPQTVIYKDQLNRTVTSKTEGLDGADIYVSTSFDSLGRTTFQSVPSFSQGETSGTQYSNFDVLNRPARKVVDQAFGGHMQVDYAYTGATTSIIATSTNGGHTLNMSRIYSGNGQLMKTTDAKSGVTQYAYDSMGNPIVLQDANNNSITASYNALGQKLNVTAPNMGDKTFAYNGLGEIANETDANGDTTYYVYDELGRLNYRYVNVVPTSSNTHLAEAAFSFDAQCKGALDSEARNNLTGSDSFQKNYTYDTQCRPLSTDTQIDGQSYLMSTQYDSNYGRVKAVTYPTGITAENVYNSRGYLTQSKNAGSSYVYHQVTAMNARGQLTEAKKANGVLKEVSVYSDETGQMKSVHTDTVAGGNQRHRIDYGYDGFGNLDWQQVENVQAGSVVVSLENYAYDKLHRLTSASRTIGGVAQGAVSYVYDAVGNFSSKGDYASSYQYGNSAKDLGGNAGPNGVRSITKVGGGTVNYGYDLNGNLISGDGKTLTYNSFNKPLTVSANGIVSSFYYGADQMRYKQVKTGIPNGDETTIYVGKSYEEITHNGVVTKRVYIGDAIVNEIEGGSEAGTKIGFVHRDRLGSVVTITDELGNVVDNKSYDAFGKPRKGTMENATTATLDWIRADGNLSLHTERGFTDHEHLDDAQLIHMNGRVYDYNLGRFLSVDPFIQSPGNSQSMNPYSYIMNNPLAGVDPSGYVASCDGGFCGGYGEVSEHCVMTCLSVDGDNGNDEEEEKTSSSSESEEKKEGVVNKLSNTQDSTLSYYNAGAYEFGIGAVKGSTAAMLEMMNDLNPITNILSSLGLGNDYSVNNVWGGAASNEEQFGMDIGPLISYGGVTSKLGKLLKLGMRRFVPNFAGSGGGIRYIHSNSTSNMVSQELSMSCGAACARQILRDSGLDFSESVVRELAKVNSKTGASIDNVVNALNKLNSNASYVGGGVGPDAFGALNRKGSWIAALKPDVGPPHFVIVDGVDDAGRVMLRDPWGTKAPGVGAGLQGTVTVDDFMEYWRRTFHQAIFKE